MLDFQSDEMIFAFDGTEIRHRTALRKSSFCLLEEQHTQKR
jgi:hypothetical protein